ncbi:arsenate reductase (glutaredoxin) [bacterium]|nr:arsenate reductase (glutaredoxin) [bacterium]
MPKTATIYHNPRCSTSRKVLALLSERGAPVEIIEYLKTPPTPAGLERLLGLLRMEPEEIVRKREPVYKALGLATRRYSRKELIRLLCENPILIERPIVVVGDKAVLARPPESVLAILR